MASVVRAATSSTLLPTYTPTGISVCLSVWLSPVRLCSGAAPWDSTGDRGPGTVWTPLVSQLPYVWPALVQLCRR